jgi:predicted DNA-binding protein (UPF0251 family)
MCRTSAGWKYHACPGAVRYGTIDPRAEDWRLVDEDESDAVVSSPEQQMLARQRDARVREAVALLPERERSAILLVYVEDLSYAEVAKILDVPVTTLVNILYRARQHLREKVADDAPRTDKSPRPKSPTTNRPRRMVLHCTPRGSETSGSLQVGGAIAVARPAGRALVG